MQLGANGPGTANLRAFPIVVSLMPKPTMAAPASSLAKKATHWVAAVLPCLLAVAVLADLSSVSRRYFYCLAMHQARSEACCSSSSEQRSARAETVEIKAEDCCEGHTLPAVAPWTPAPRSAEVVAPQVASAAVPAYEPNATPVFGVPPGVRDAMRTGPPWSPSRERARLMIFHI